MPLSLSGTLTDPYGDPRGDATITFRAIVTSNSVLEHANASAITDSSGAYSVTVEFGRYNIEVKESGSPSPRIIAKNVPINGDTTAADLNELVVAANGYDDLTPQIVVEFRELTAEARGYRDEAQASAQSASENATATAADRQAVANDRAHVDQQRQAVDAAADEVEADRLAAQQARTGAEDAQGASETARDESRAWATGDGVIDNISGTDRFSARVETDRAASERQGAADAATAAADSETNAAGSAQTALTQADRAESEADRATTYADNAGYVTRQRLAEQSTLNLDFARGKYLVDDGELIETTNASEILSVERASPKWVMGPNGKLREVPPNTIARKWRNGVPQGALIEESRTNLLTYSSQFDNAVWSGGATVSVDAITAPDGLVSADKLAKGSESYTGKGQYVTLVTGNTYTYSYYAKSGSLNSTSIMLANDNFTNFYARAVIDLTDGSIISIGQGSEDQFNAVSVGNGWWRLSATATVTQSSCRVYTYVGTHNEAVAGDIYARGAQLEEGSQPSSPIITQDVPVTREADSIYKPLGDEYNPNGFSVYAEAQQNSDTGSVFFLNNEGLSNSIRVGLPTNGDRAMYVKADGIIRKVVDLSEFSNYTKGDPAKIALAVDPNNNRIRLTINGETVENRTGYFPSLDKIRLGGITPSNNNINGTIHDYIMYPRVLTASEAQELTQ